MKKNVVKYRVLSFMLCIVLLLSNLAFADAQSSYQEQGQYITTNTYFKNINMKNESGIFSLNMIESIINVGTTKIETADSGKTVGRSSVLNQALKKNDQNRRVVGAINGDFFNTKVLKGLPTGISIIDGEVRSAASGAQVFGVTSKGLCFIDKVTTNSRFLYRNKSIEIVRVNKMRTKDGVALYTPSYEPSTQTDSPGTEIVIKDIQLPLKSNTEVVGTIYEVIKNTMNTPIPADGVVISAHGLAAEELNSLNAGEKVAINLSFSRKDIQFAVTGMPRLLENKMLSKEIDTWADAKVRAPRTAIGIKGGRVVMLTVDGRQEGFSNGMNLYEFANFLLSQGVENAINLDGGGSTSFVTRKQGDASASLVNSPSDGSARIISNSIQIVSYGPYTEPAYIKFKEDNVKVYKGSNFSVDFYTMDKNYNLLDNPTTAKPAIKNTLGVLAKDGTIKASTTPQKGIVEIVYGKLKGKMPVEVVDKVPVIKIETNLSNIEKNKEIQLVAHAYDENGKKIFINPEAIKWTVATGIGKVNSKGILTTGNKDITGKVTATVGKTVTVAEAKIGDGPITIASLDDATKLEVKSIRGEGTVTGILADKSKELVKGGKGSIKLGYKLSEEETSAVYMKFKEPVNVAGIPIKIGLWVYGNKSNHWIRGNYINSIGERKTIDFTPQGGLDWEGWKFLTADISKDEKHPIAIEQIYIAEPEADKKDSGEIILDEIMAIYK